MLLKKMNPEAAATAPGSGSCVFVVRRTPDNTPTVWKIEDFALDYIARRYRLPVPLARIVAELAGIGARIG